MSRCRDARLAEPAVAKPPPPSAPNPADVELAPPGGIEAAVAAYVASLGFVADDPRAILGTIAIRLAKRVDEEGAVPAAVRELRVLLAQLGEVPNGLAGEVDEIRVRREQRRIAALLAQAG